LISKECRVAVIGSGRIAEEHLRFLRDAKGVRLAGVCDLDPFLAARAARIYGGEAYQDAETMLSSIAPDVVHVLTPPHSHEAMVQVSVDAGARLVVVEKPAFLNDVDTDRMISVAESEGVTLVEDHNYLFNAPVQQLLSLIEKGDLGELREIEVRMSMPLGSSRYENAADRAAAGRLAGGLLHEFIPHLSYLALAFLPDPVISSVAWRKTDQDTSVAPDALDVQLNGAGGTSGVLKFRSRSQPSTTTIQVNGDIGWAYVDLQNPLLRVNSFRGAGTELSPVIERFADGFSTMKASVSAFRQKFHGSSIYAGIGIFLERVYSAHLAGDPMPVSHGDIRRAASLVHEIVRTRP
jgi:predicted dehydrogenase